MKQDKDRAGKFRERLAANGEVCEKYLEMPEKYIYEYTLKVNGKQRRIATYRTCGRGRQLRDQHRLFDRYLRSIHTYSASSYAYRERTGIADCLRMHLNNEVFLKADIHAFFDTVEPELLEKAVADAEIFAGLALTPRKTISACFYKGRMPIGFVTSPVLSDIYLSGVDAAFEDREGIVYTRYADDLIISASGADAEERLRRIKNELERQLRALGLELNARKTYIRRLKLPGDAIHLLGLNLVRTEQGRNRVTVSDSYIREVSKDIGRYLTESVRRSDEENKKEFDRIYGRICFIRYASRESYDKLQKMVRIKTGMSTELTPAGLRKLETRKAIEKTPREKKTIGRGTARKLPER